MERGAESSSQQEGAAGQVEAEEEGTGVWAVNGHRWRRNCSNTRKRNEEDKWSEGVWAQLDARM